MSHEKRCHLCINPPLRQASGGRVPWSCEHGAVTESGCQHLPRGNSQERGLQGKELRQRDRRRLQPGDPCGGRKTGWEGSQAGQKPGNLTGFGGRGPRFPERGEVDTEEAWGTWPTPPNSDCRSQRPVCSCAHPAPECEAPGTRAPFPPVSLHQPTPLCPPLRLTCFGPGDFFSFDGS